MECMDLLAGLWIVGEVVEEEGVGEEVEEAGEAAQTWDGY